MSKIALTLALVLSIAGCVAGQSSQVKQMDIVVQGGAPTLPAAGLDRIYSDSAGFHCLTSGGVSCFTSYNLALQTNGTLNSNQALLNLVAGTNITLANTAGNVTITAAGGGGGGSAFQINGSGIISSSTINFQNTNFITWSNPSNGNLQAFLLFPGLTGDVTNTLGSTVVSLALSGIPSGPCVKPTFDTKGRGTLCNTKITGNTDISGPILSSNMPAFSGDATSTVGTSVLTLATTGVGAGTCVKPTVDAKGRVISCTFQIAGSTDINGVVAASNIPAFNGDATNTSGSLTLIVGKINGTTVPAAPVVNQVLLTTNTSVGTWTSIPDCQDGAGHLNYTASTHIFTCGVAGGGGGGGNTTSVGLVTGNLPVATGTTALADSGIVANKVAKINASNTWTGTLNSFVGTETTVANAVNPTDAVNLQTMLANGTVNNCTTLSNIAFYTATNDVSCDTRLSDSGGVNPVLSFTGTISAPQLTTSGAGAGQYDLQCGTTQSSAGPGYSSIAAPTNCAAGVRIINPAVIGVDGQPLVQLSHSGTDAVIGFSVLPISGGGTGQTTAPTAFTALAPAASLVGSVIYYNGTSAGWSILAGNTGSAACLQETSSGVPSWGACGSGGGGSFNVNGSLVSSPNLNNTTPAAASGFVNSTLQVSGSNISVQSPDPSKVANLPTSIQLTPCPIYIDGTGTGGAIQSSDVRVARCKNDFGSTLTVMSISCWGDNTDSLQVQIDVATNGISGGTNILAGSGCTPGNKSWTACTLNGTPTIANLSSLYATPTAGAGTLTKAYCQVVAKKS